MSSKSAFLALVLLASLVCSSCSTMDTIDEFLGEDRPQASIESVALRDIRLDSAALDVDVRVDNPYSVALPVAALEAALSSEGRRLVETAHEGQLTVPPGGSAVLPLVVDLSFTKLLEFASGVRPGMVVPYRADVTVAVDAPVLGRVSIPLQHDGEFPIPAPPSIQVKNLRLDQASLSGLRGRLSLDVGNTNDFAMNDTALDFELRLGDRLLSSMRRADALGDIAPGQSGQVDVDFSLSATEVGFGLLDMLTGKNAQVRTLGKLGFDTPFGLIGTNIDELNSVPITRSR